MKLKYMKKLLAISLAATMLAGTAGSTTVFEEETVQSTKNAEESEEAEPDSELKSSAKGENYDIIAPVINSIALDKQGKTVTAGDTVTISVDAYDTGVGIEGVVYPSENHALYW